MVVAAPEQIDWLATDVGQEQLRLAATAPAPSAARIAALRRAVGEDRALLILEQVELRRRARSKFSRAERMLFAPQLLEQASEERIAAHKSLRFPSQGGPLADLCCGLGGDLLALGRRGPVIAVDRSRLAIHLARANCRALAVGSAHFVVADAAAFDVGACAAWHIDPDRRAQGARTSQPDASQPDIAALQRLVGRQPAAAVKLAPAATVPQEWARDAELEWIGARRECRQQVVWLGPLARRPGQHTATVLDSAGQAATVSGPPDVEIPVAAAVRQFVYEPHAAVLAARLLQTFAAKHELAAVAPGIAYLTGSRRLQSPLCAAFEVVAVLPLDRKKLRTLLRARGIGRLEIKVRGVSIAPQTLRHELRPLGDRSATILVVGTPRHVSAIVAERMPAVP